MMLTARTTVSLAGAFNQPSVAELLTDRLKMRRAQPDTAVYL